MEANHFSKDQYIDWCRERALRMLNSRLPLVVLTELLSNLRSHPGTRNHPAVDAAHRLLSIGKLMSKESVRYFVENFVT